MWHYAQACATPEYVTELLKWPTKPVRAGYMIIDADIHEGDSGSAVTTHSGKRSGNISAIACA